MTGFVTALTDWQRTISCMKIMEWMGLPEYQHQRYGTSQRQAPGAKGRAEYLLLE
jgi:hypothetical protein